MMLYRSSVKKYQHVRIDRPFNERIAASDAVQAKGAD